MLCWITILGGVLIMMGRHSRSEALFYYFRSGVTMRRWSRLWLCSKIPCSPSVCASAASARTQKIPCTAQVGSAPAQIRQSQSARGVAL